MILDKLENLSLYASMNPLFQEVVDFVKNHDLQAMECGKYPIHGDDLFVNITEAKPKTKEQARVETHRKMIDIQIPLTGTEEHGWIALSALKEAPYDEAKDISFYEEKGTLYFEVKPMEMTIYFPTDGHAPAITPVTVKKAIFKVRA